VDPDRTPAGAAGPCHASRAALRSRYTRDQITLIKIEKRKKSVLPFFYTFVHFTL